MSRVVTFDPEQANRLLQQRQTERRLYPDGTPVRVTARLVRRHLRRLASPAQAEACDFVGTYIMPSLVTTTIYDPAQDAMVCVRAHLVEDDTGRLRRVLAEHIHPID